MNCLKWASQSRRRLVVPLLLAAMFGLSSQSSLAAPKYGTSLDWVPADVSFYSSSLRLREQFDMVMKSKAWQKLKDMPAVQQAWQTVQFFLYFPGPGAVVRQFLEDDEFAELRELLIDAASNEVFVYGDKSSTDFLDTFRNIVSAIQYSSAAVDLDDTDTTARVILNSLNTHVDRLAAPGLVMGFKVSDAERAKRQIDQLKEHLEGPLGNLPNFEGRLKKKSVGGSEFLVLELDGKMIDIPWHQFEQEQGEYEKLKTKLENLKAVICIGVRENYLLFAIEPSTDVLAKLGSGKSLAEVKELEPLAKFADKKLVSVSYSSKQFIETLNNADQQIENTINLLKQALSQAGLSEEAEERIGQDLNEVADDLKGVLPKPGAMTQFSFLTNRGVESYGHDWGENKYLDGSKPLPLLDHVGGNPLLAYVARGKYSPEQYEILRKWAKKGFGYFEEFGVPQMDEAGQETFKKFKEIGTPLVDRLDKATSQLLIPSMADGQSALVLDAKLVSSKWFEGMRQNEQSLPMIEVAMVLGVSDAGQLKKAIDEYKSILEDLIAKLKQEEPDLIPPNFKLPSPQTREVKTAAGTGTVYYYKLPEQAGVDAQLTPNAGLSDRVAVLSVSPKQSERILKDAPLQVSSGGPLSDRSKPMATAMYFNNAELIDKLTPWAEFAVKQVVGAMQAAGAEEGDEDAKPAATGDDPMTKSYIEQVHTVMDLLKCIRTYESATYPEGGAMVTHSVTEIKDVP